MKSSEKALSIIIDNGDFWRFFSWKFAEKMLGKAWENPLIYL